MDCGSLFASVGTVIIDDIVLPDGRTRMGLPGGGATHAAMGMRVWAEQVALLTPLHADFPPGLWLELAERFDVGGMVKRTGCTPRAWQLFEADGTRNEVFRTDFCEMVRQIPRPFEFPQGARGLKGVHLHCAPEHVPAWVDFLRKHENPIILWEPWDIFCVPENRARFGELAQLVDVVSPGLRDVQMLAGVDDPREAGHLLIGWGARLAALRMGAAGSLIIKPDGGIYSVPALAVESVVDVTGAGNAYCGGFLVGLALTGGDPLKAGTYGAVSASFALEQYGALYPLAGLAEKAWQRLEALWREMKLAV